MTVYRTAAGFYVDPNGDPADAPAAESAEASGPDFNAMKVDELEKLAAGMEITGTGKDGAVLKADYVAALSA